MIEQLPSIILVEANLLGGSIGFPASRDQRIEVLTAKLNEAISHINVLEEKLLSAEDFSG